MGNKNSASKKERIPSSGDIGHTVLKPWWISMAEDRITETHNFMVNRTKERIVTEGWNTENLKIKNLTLSVRDVGGRITCPPNKRLAGSAVIFVVDSTSDMDRMQDAKYELHCALKENSLKNALFVVMANKQDHEKALPVETIAEKLELPKIAQKGAVIGTSAVDDSKGLVKAAGWLWKELDRRYGSGVSGNHEIYTGNHEILKVPLGQAGAA